MGAGYSWPVTIVVQLRRRRRDLCPDHHGADHRCSRTSVWRASGDAGRRARHPAVQRGRCAHAAEGENQNPSSGAAPGRTRLQGLRKYDTERGLRVRRLEVLWCASSRFPGTRAGQGVAGGLQQHLLHPSWCGAPVLGRVCPAPWIRRCSVGGSAGDGHASAPGNESRARNDRWLSAAWRQTWPRRHLLAHLHAGIARPHRRASRHQLDGTGARAEQWRLYAEREHRLVQPQVFLTNPRSETSGCID